MDYHNLDMVLKQFENLIISDYNQRNRIHSYRNHRNRKYNLNFFPAAERVVYFVDKSPKRWTWLKHPDEHEIKWYIQLTPGTKQFNKVIDHLAPSIRAKNNILEVHKVMNKYLERQYSLKKEMKKRNAPCEEYIMCHYTIEKNLDDIVLNNFNWRLCGLSRGHKYGHGISFSPDSSFAEQFCKSKKIKMMFVVRVLISKAHIGNENMILPNHGFDTTGSPKNTVYVKFEDSEFYPEYIIFYSRI